MIFPIRYIYFQSTIFYFKVLIKSILCFFCLKKNQQIIKSVFVLEGK